MHQLDGTCGQRALLRHRGHERIAFIPRSATCNLDILHVLRIRDVLRCPKPVQLVIDATEVGRGELIGSVLLDYFVDVLLVLGLQLLQLYLRM